MSDRLAKSHPWRATINRPFVETIGALVVQNARTGEQEEISPPTTIGQAAGERVFRKRSDAAACVTAWRARHGDDIVSDVYRAEV